MLVISHLSSFARRKRLRSKSLSFFLFLLVSPSSESDESEISTRLSAEALLRAVSVCMSVLGLTKESSGYVIPEPGAI